MGAVYKARQPRLDRFVALKVLSCSPELLDTFSLRFEQEAQLLAMLHHPHIVTLFDFGEIEDGPDGHPIFYFLMEYIDGGNLEDRLRSQDDIPPDEAFRLISECCDALAFAHAKGVLHRDIKPANLLLDGEGRLRVADFGVAKILAEGESRMMTGLTLTGTTMGTPHYMAPELWDGPDSADHRADLYSLGVVFYQLLTGERPAGVFQAPSKLVDVDRTVDTTVFKALEKNPERRYQSAGEMQGTIARVAKRHEQRANRKRKSAPLYAIAFALVAGIAAWLTGAFQIGEKTERGQPGKSEQSFVADSGQSPLSASVKEGRLTTWSLYPEHQIDLDHSIASGAFRRAEIASPAWNEWNAWKPDGTLRSSFKNVAGRENWIAAAAGVAITKDGDVVPQPGSGEAVPHLKRIPRGEAVELTTGYDNPVNWYVVRTKSGDLFPFATGESISDQWRKVETRLESVQDGTAVSGNLSSGMILRKNGEILCWNLRKKEDPFVDPPAELGEVVSIACGNNNYLALTANGRIWNWNSSGESLDVPEFPGHVVALRANISSIPGGSAAQMEDGSWRAWGIPGGEEIEKRIAELGPVVDLSFDVEMTGKNRRARLLWIKPEDAKTKSESPSPTTQFHRPGRLKTWSLLPEEDLDLSKAEQYDDFVEAEIEGATFPRWQARRNSGELVGYPLELDTLIDATPTLVIVHNGTVESTSTDLRPEVLRLVGKRAVAIEDCHDTVCRWWFARTPDGRIKTVRELAIEDPRHTEFQDWIQSLQGVADLRTQYGTGIVLHESGKISTWDLRSDKSVMIAPPPDLLPVIEVDCGLGTYITLDADGKVTCWNSNGTKIPVPEFNKPVVSVRANVGPDPIFAAQLEDSTWQTWGLSRGQEIERRISELGPTTDLSFDINLRGTNRRARLLWIEPTRASAEEQSKTKSAGNDVTPGRLHAYGNFPITGNQVNLSATTAFDDFVDVFGGPGRWVALRRNGQTVSSDGKADRTGIRKIVKGLDDSVALIDVDGQLVFPDGETPQGFPSLSSYTSIVDATLGIGHGLLLTKTGEAIPWDSDGSWKRPPEEFLKNVSRVGALGDYAATLLENGEFHLWGRNGPVPLSFPNDLGRIRDFASINMDHFVIESEGNRLWRLYFPRNLPPSKAIFASIDNGTLKSGKFYLDAQNAWKLAGVAEAARKHQDLIDTYIPEGTEVMSGYGRENQNPDTSWSWRGYVMWIEPAQRSALPLEVPATLKAMRKRGGRLRSWTTKEETMTGLELADGIDNFVRLDGANYQAVRWLAVRAEGENVSNLTDFDRSGELVSLDTHQGVLKSGELLDCWDDQRKLHSANVLDAEIGNTSVGGFRLLLNRNGTIEFKTSGNNNWKGDELLDVREALRSIRDATQIDAHKNSGIVLRSSGEVVSWNSEAGLVSPEFEIRNAVEVACANSGWFARLADGTILSWQLPRVDWVDFDPPEDLGPAVAIRACGTVCAAQMADGSWRAWGKDLTSGLIDKIESIGPAVDLLFPTMGTLLWIEPAEAASTGLPDLASLPRGRLRAAGTGPDGNSPDLKKALEYDDFVDVGGRLGQWVALRANGETISADGKCDFSDIARIGHSFGNKYVLIGSDGKLRFRSGEEMILPAEIDGAFCVDAKIGLGHGIALTSEGYAMVFGPRYEGNFTFQDPSYESPQWPLPPAEVLTGIRDIAVSQTHAASLKNDGTLSIFGWKGVIPFPEESSLGKVVDIASSEDEIWILDDRKQVWRLGLDRSPKKGPVGHAGKLLKTASDATAMEQECWLEPGNSWRSNRSDMDELLKANRIRSGIRFALGDGLHSGQHFHSLLWIEPKSLKIAD